MSSTPASHSLTCIFPPGTAGPKDVINLLPPFLNISIYELTAGTALLGLA